MGALAGLAGEARPELFLFLPILVLAALPDLKDPVRRRNLLLACVWFTVFAGSFVVVNLLADGRPLPNTFYAKTGTRGLFNALVAVDFTEIARAFTSGALSAWNLVFQFTTSQSLILATGVLVGALVMLGVLGQGPRGGGVLVVLLVFMPMLTGLFAPQPPILSQQGRYVGHFVLLYFVAASVGVAWLAEQVTKRGRTIVLVIVVIALGRMLTTSLRDAKSYAAQVQSINHMQLGAAEWVKTHTPPDALVATNDIGAMAFFSGRRVLDTYGLVTPEIVQYRRNGDSIPFLEQKRPAVVIVYPEWFPEVAARPDLFEEVHRFTISPRVVAPADSFVVYATHWR